MQKILILGGPTASGKSALALRLAAQIQDAVPNVNGAVIINADSMQVYRELPVLTAQPREWEKKQAPHLLYGFMSAAEHCSAGIWLEHAKNAIEQAHREKKLPIVVGGTGMYLRCLTDGVAVIPEIAQEVRRQARDMLNDVGHKQFHILLNERDPIMGEKLSSTDTQRMLRAWEVLEQTSQSIHAWQQKPHKQPFGKEQFVTLLLMPPRERLYAQCNQRFLEMLNKGALQEIDTLYEMKLDPLLPAMKALGVPELIAFKEGRISLEEAIDLAQTHTRQFAKRQRTWFRHQFRADVALDDATGTDFCLGALRSACR